MKFTCEHFQASNYNAPMPLSEGAMLTLEHVGRQHAGSYQCKAENGVREAVYAEVNLKVLCKHCLNFAFVSVLVCIRQFI